MLTKYKACGCGVLCYAAALLGQPAQPTQLTGSVVQWGLYVLPAVAPETRVKFIASGSESAFAIDADGALFGWRWNGHNEIPPLNQISNVTAFSADTHTLALKSDGTVLAWGDNADGGTNVPAGLSNVIAISATGGHSLALRSDGTVVAWGDDFCGESQPPAGLSNIVAVSAGVCCSFLLKSDGRVLYVGNHTNAIVSGISNVTSIAAGAGEVWTVHSDGRVMDTRLMGAPWAGVLPPFTNTVVAGLSNIVSVAIGDGILALQNDGTVFNLLNLAGLPPCHCDAIAVASGGGGQFALRADGTLIQFGPFFVPTYPPWTYTRNAIGLPTGGGNLALSADHTLVCLDCADPLSLASLGNVTAVAAGYYGFRLALTSSGGVLAWGENSDGQCDVPVNLNGVVAIAAGGYHSLALKSDGSIVGWGYNAYGQAPSNWAAGAQAISAGALHSLALRSNGTVYAWGYNNHQQCYVPYGLTNVISIAAGGAHNLALRSDGIVVAWGYNNHGQSTVPAGLSNVVAIAAGGDHSLALKSDGSIVAWGSNDSGESTVPNGLGPAIAISAGRYDSMALVLPTRPLLTLNSQLSTINHVVLSWPSVYSGFVPQSSYSLNPANWLDCTNAPAIFGGQNFLTNSLSSGALFFRLKK